MPTAGKVGRRVIKAPFLLAKGECRTSKNNLPPAWVLEVFAQPFILVKDGPAVGRFNGALAESETAKVWTSM